MDMADKTTITIKPDLGDYRSLLKAISVMDKQAQGALKDEVASISRWTAQGMIYASYGALMPMQAAIVAQTIRPARDRVPTVYIGGAKGRASGGANAGQLLFGNEFGSDRNAKGSKGAFPNGGYRFPERSNSQGRGNTGYWIFPSLKDMQPTIRKRWFDAVTRVLDNWARTS
jgi:hypothetical protein